MTDWILYTIVASFIAWEAVAHYAFHNVGMHTLSDRVAWLEHRGGWPIRVLVAAATVVLGLHLEGAF